MQDFYVRRAIQNDHDGAGSVEVVAAQTAGIDMEILQEDPRLADGGMFLDKHGLTRHCLFHYLGDIHGTLTLHTKEFVTTAPTRQPQRLTPRNL